MPGLANIAIHFILLVQFIDVDSPVFSCEYKDPDIGLNGTNGPDQVIPVAYFLGRSIGIKRKVGDEQVIRLSLLDGQLYFMKGIVTIKYVIMLPYFKFLYCFFY